VNFDWSWCPPAPAGRPIDLRIELGGLGRFTDLTDADYVPYRRRPAGDHSKHATVRVALGSDGHYRVSYADGAEFVIDATASEIFGVSGARLTHDDLVVYLQGPVLGFVLRLRGITCLHASAAVVDGRAFVVMGGAGMGKSTTAAMLARLGLPVLTDDVLALDDRGTGFEAQPGLPRILLWPASVGALFGAPDALPRIVESWDKRYLDLTEPGYRFASRAVPLGAVYVLGERLEPREAPEITELRGTNALAFLVANTYANDFLDTRLRSRELDVLGRLVTHIPVRIVRAPHDRGALPRICEAMLADFRRGS
jgi:hypothetical protein